MWIIGSGSKEDLKGTKKKKKNFFNTDWALENTSENNRMRFNKTKNFVKPDSEPTGSNEILKRE